jgi:hypothetical protein
MNLRKLFSTFESDPDRPDGQSVGDYIAERYEEVRDTQQQLDKLAQERCEIEKEHKSKLANIDAVVRRVQTNCTHPLTTFHPDVSGNNDSHTDCDVCGLELRRHGMVGYDG